MDDFIEWLETLYKKITWKDVKLVGAGMAWGFCTIVLWNYIDDISEWPWFIVLFVECCWGMVGLLLVESALES